MVSFFDLIDHRLVEAAVHEDLDAVLGGAGVAVQRSVMAGSDFW